MPWRWPPGISPPGRRAAAARRALCRPAAPNERQVVAIDKSDAVQTEIRIGSLGVPRDNPDYLAAERRQ